jgi:hypothetical protein
MAPRSNANSPAAVMFDAIDGAIKEVMSPQSTRSLFSSATNVLDAIPSNPRDSTLSTNRRITEQEVDVLIADTSGRLYS